MELLKYSSDILTKCHICICILISCHLMYKKGRTYIILQIHIIVQANLCVLVTVILYH